MSMPRRPATGMKKGGALRRRAPFYREYRRELLLELEHHGFVAAAATEPEDEAEVDDEHDQWQDRDGAQRVVLRLAIRRIHRRRFVARQRGALGRIDRGVGAEDPGAIGLQRLDQLRVV